MPVNFDLVLGLSKTIEEFGDRSERRMARYKHDHDAVNRLLAAALPEVVECLRKRYRGEVTARFTGRLLPVTGAMVLGGAGALARAGVEGRAGSGVRTQLS